jgi:hypothetical protein
MCFEWDERYFREQAELKLCSAFLKVIEVDRSWESSVCLSALTAVTLPNEKWPVLFADRPLLS